MRLFSGVWPSDEASRLLAALDRPEVPGVRWTTPEQWHVTLAFLGDVDEERAATLAGALRVVAAGVDSPLEAVMGPATELLGRAVLCVPVAGLDGLASAVWAAFVAAGVDPGEGRPFRGHVTLARARGGRLVPRRLAGAPVAATWRVGAVDLVRSTLASGGARYETVARATVPRWPG